MKKSMLFLAVALCWGGCSKDSTAEDVTGENPGESTRIECIGGTLHFPSSEVCFETMEALSEDKARLEFEKSYNFCSMRSYIDGMYRELDACNSREEYDALLETFSDYLEYSEGRLVPRVSSVAYQRIADESGVFYVDGVKHTVNAKQVLIEKIDPITRAVSEEAIDYEVPFTLPGLTTRDEITENRYTDNTYEIPGYKVFARTNVIRAVLFDRNRMYSSAFAFQIHTSSQKKKALIGWNSYTTRFQVEYVHYDLNISNRRFVFGAYNYYNGWNSEEEVYDYYVTLSINYDDPFVGFQVIPMPVNFSCIVHRVHTNATGNCGCLTHRAPCKGVPQLYMTECSGVYRPYL